MSVKINQTVLEILILSSVVGNHQFVSLEIVNLKIFTMTFFITHESNVWAQVERIVSLPLGTNKKLFNTVCHLTISSYI